MVITSAEEFIALRLSDVMSEYHRAAHDEASEAVWFDVIQRFPDMKRWVAHNKTVPLSILEVLSRDSDPDVRWCVAVKRKAGPEILGRLARDADERVRHRVAFNAKTPEAILDLLAEDFSTEVAETARERREMRRAKRAKSVSE